MALDVTIGGDTADSYNTLSEANDYFQHEPFFSTTWSALSDSVKENWLRLSTRAIDRFAGFRGVRQTTTQALQFPRVLDRHTYVHFQFRSQQGMYYHRHSSDFEDVLQANTIPKDVKRAQLEMLAFLYNNKTSASAIDGREFDSLKVLNGLVEIEYSGLKDSKAEAAGGASIMSVRHLLREVTTPLRWRRA